jgi:hypothetical protein
VFVGDQAQMATAPSVVSNWLDSVRHANGDDWLADENASEHLLM